MKLCECGCGNPAPIAKQTRSILGHIKGQPARFILGHNSKGLKNPNWNGGKIKDKDGRNLIYKPNHTKKNARNYIYAHIMIAEMAVGKHLPEGAVVHHHDGNVENDKNSNLVICENQAYHAFLHQRIRAYKACGHADWRKCRYCHRYDHPENLFIKPNGEGVHHRDCHNKYQREYRQTHK